MKKEQLDFGREYISARQILKEHYQGLGRKGGVVITPKKTAACRRNAAKARVVKLEKLRLKRESPQ